MGFWQSVRNGAMPVDDFALPPRCAVGGEIIDDTGGLCPPCWSGMEWLGQGGCSTCGLPLEATAADRCGRCLAEPPLIDRIPAAVAYDELPKSIAFRLQYGGKVELARTMARYMVPLARADSEDGDEAVLVPVPLHRGRFWRRGFNQSTVIARDLSRRLGLPVEHTG